MLGFWVLGSGFWVLGFGFWACRRYHDPGNNSNLQRRRAFRCIFYFVALHKRMPLQSLTRINRCMKFKQI
ncbi:MAG: hypothetical protein EOO48_02250 [Flavobacterium sp.]|nr:MAG: hypothetical protein EOO48_02250 [Flavobacterium sp.]